MYRWLLVTETDNGLCFYNIFETRELAVLHLEGIVDESEWHEDASGDLRFRTKHYSYHISSEPYTTVNNCGGCAGMGSHRKHCVHNPNYDYRLKLADQAESLADSIGSNNTGAANNCYTAAGLLRQQVREERIRSGFEPVIGNS